MDNYFSQIASRGVDGNNSFLNPFPVTAFYDSIGAEEIHSEPQSFDTASAAAVHPEQPKITPVTMATLVGHADSHGDEKAITTRQDIAGTTTYLENYVQRFEHINSIQNNYVETTEYRSQNKNTASKEDISGNYNNIEKDKYVGPLKEKNNTQEKELFTTTKKVGLKPVLPIATSELVTGERRLLHKPVIPHLVPQINADKNKFPTINKVNAAKPKLIIGKIVVEILPSKQPATKIINRHITPPSPTISSKYSKLGFGMGQL